MAGKNTGASKEAKDADALPPEVSGSRAAFERFLPEAMALGGPLMTPHMDVGIALVNVKAGTAALLAEEARLRGLPGFDIELVRSMPELAHGVIYAVNLVDRHAPKPTRELLARASVLRGTLLPLAEVLAHAGLFPEHEVERIRKGTGFIDLADDCVALARLFTDHADALRGKTAVTAAEVREAADLGTELRDILRPHGAHAAPPTPELAEALSQRDRMWTLLSRRYEDARRAGAWLFGVTHLGEHVPALGSRVHGKAKEAAPAEAKPAAE